MLTYTVYSFFFLCHNIYKNEGNAKLSFLIGVSHFVRFRKFLIATDTTDQISAFLIFFHVKVIRRKANN